MALKLCLHGVRIAHPETFTEDVAKLLKLTVKQGKLREKEYGENLSARFRRSKLLGGPLQPVKVRVMEGILLVDSHLSDLLDVEFSYRAGSEELVLTAVQQLLSGGDGFVVAEPDLKAVSVLAGPHHQLVLASAVPGSGEQTAGTSAACEDPPSAFLSGVF